VYSFPSSDAGPYPRGALIQGLDGSFYGVAADTAALYRIGTDGTATTVYTFTPPVFPVGTLVQDGSGNIYGLAQGANGELFRVTPSGTESGVSSFGQDIGLPISGLRLASNGTFYGVSSYVQPIEFNGQTIPSINGTVFAVTSAGVESTLFAFGDDTVSPLVQAGDGHYYGVADIAGTYGLGAIIRF
jgi:hypothetical protein